MQRQHRELEDFHVGEMASKMRDMAPVLWNLLGRILDPPGQCDSMSNLMGSGEYDASESLMTSLVQISIYPRLRDDIV
jgi:hypothetical protein